MMIVGNINDNSLHGVKLATINRVANIVVDADGNYIVSEIEALAIKEEYNIDCEMIIFKPIPEIE